MGIIYSKENYCTLCKTTGHIRESHAQCLHCVEQHKTAEHECETCQELGHSHKQHCGICNELHPTYKHICTVCGGIGHQDEDENHPLKCHICDMKGDDKLKYTHHTDGHISHIGVVNMSPEEREMFKYCNHCERIGYIENNKCFFCSKNIPEKVRCYRKNCGYQKENGIEKYCPYCGCRLVGL